MTLAIRAMNTKRSIQRARLRYEYTFKLAVLLTRRGALDSNACAKLLRVSLTQTIIYLNVLIDQGRVERVRHGRHWTYRMVNASCPNQEA